MIQFILTGIVAFISTNIDDLFLLILFFGNSDFRTGQIIAGQLLGIGTLVLLSLVLSLLGLVVGKAYIGLLGIFPIFIGVRALLRLLRKRESEEIRDIDQNSGKGDVLVVSGVTIANGGDNVGIYVPLFAAIGWTGKITIIIVFFLMTLLLCLISKYLTRQPRVAKIIDKYGHVVTPFILIALGIFILYESGAANLPGRLLIAYF